MSGMITDTPCPKCGESAVLDEDYTVLEWDIFCHSCEYHAGGSLMDEEKYSRKGYDHSEDGRIIANCESKSGFKTQNL